MVHPRKFIRDSLGTALSQYLARFALLARGMVAAAALGPLGFGGWNALNLLLDYGSYASCGALQGLELRLPSAVVRGEEGEARRLMSGAWSVVALGSTLFALGVIAWLAMGRFGVARSWGWGPPLLMLLAAGLQLAIQYHAAALRARGEFRTVGEAHAAQAVVGSGIGIALVSRYGVWGLVGGWIVGSLGALLWMRRGPLPPPLAVAAPRAGAPLVRLGLPVFGFFIISLVLRSLDRLAFVQVGATESLGLYSLGLMAPGLILYLPEAAAAVMYPRLSAAAQGARDPELTRTELKQTHRALAVALPPVVAVAMVWAAPAVAWILPAFREGVMPLRLLALGGLMLAGSTLPGYFVIAGGPRGRLIAVGVLVALLAAALIFSVAARDPRPTPIAAAAAAGYAAFALTMVLIAAPRLFAGLGGRLGFIATSFVPGLWAGGLAIAACRIGDPESPGQAALRSIAVLVACIPVLWWFARGAGLRRIAAEWLTGRAVPV